VFLLLPVLEKKLLKKAEISPKLVIMDIRLKAIWMGASCRNHLEFQIPVVFTGYADKDTVERAKITGAFGYIIKPFKERFICCIETALQRYQLEMNLKRGLGGLKQFLEV